MSDFIVVSFVVKGHGNIEDLKKSLDKFQIKNELMNISVSEGLKFNFSQALFIQKMKNKYKDIPVVWVDPKMVFINYPIQLRVQSTSIAIHACEKTLRITRSTIFFKNNNKSNRLLTKWIEENSKFPDQFEYVNLKRVLVRCQENNAIGILPATYSIPCELITNKS